MSEPIGKNTADWLTLKHKADENEARWQAVREDLEEKLAIATEALKNECVCEAIKRSGPGYRSVICEPCQAISKIRGGE